jgi:hypothetical protein
LSPNSAGPVTLEIKDGKGNVVRRFASDDPIPPIDPELNIPTYWIRPPQTLGNRPGLHRFLWDMHYPPLSGIEPEYPISAVYRNTAPNATSPWIVPGDYSVVLTVSSKSYSQPLTAKLDPRVKASPADLTEQFEQSKKLSDNREALQRIDNRLKSLNKELAMAKERVGENAVAAQIGGLGKKLQDIAGPPVRPGAPLRLDVLQKLESLFADMQRVDAAPTQRVRAAVTEIVAALPSAMQRWQAVESQDLPALNRQLEGAGFKPIQITEQKIGEDD